MDAFFNSIAFQVGELYGMGGPILQTLYDIISFNTSYLSVVHHCQVRCLRWQQGRRKEGSIPMDTVFNFSAPPVSFLGLMQIYGQCIGQRRSISHLESYPEVNKKRLVGHLVATSNHWMSWAFRHHGCEVLKDVVQE